MNPFVTTVATCWPIIVSLSACARSTVMSEAAPTRPADSVQRFAELRRDGASFWWQSEGRCEAWRLEEDRVSHLDEEDDGRIVRRSFRVDQRGDQIELTGEDIELLRPPAPPQDLEEGAGFGYTSEGSSGCGEVIRLGRVSATLIEVGRYRWYLDSRSCEEAQARSTVIAGGPCKR